MYIPYIYKSEILDKKRDNNNIPASYLSFHFNHVDYIPIQGRISIINNTREEVNNE